MSERVSDSAASAAGDQGAERATDERSRDEAVA